MNTVFPVISIFNTALPGAGIDFWFNTLGARMSPSHLELNVCISISGILTVRRIIGATTVSELLNEGVPLVAGALYGFHIAWRAGESIRLRYSVTGGTILSLRLDEVLEAC